MLAACIFCAMFTVASAKYVMMAMGNMQRSAVMRVPLWIVYLALPVQGGELRNPAEKDVYRQHAQGCDEQSAGQKQLRIVSRSITRSTTTPSPPATSRSMS